MSADSSGQFHESTALGVEIGSEVHAETLAKRKSFVYSVSRIYGFSVLLLNCRHEGHRPNTSR